jgi:putative transposase
VEQRIPKLRKGSCLPGFLEPRRMAEKGITAVLQEANIQGVALVQANRHLQRPGQLACGETDDEVKAFLARSNEGD